MNGVTTFRLGVYDSGVGPSTDPLRGSATGPFPFADTFGPFEAHVYVIR